ncbi:MAG TPA: alpha/beta fold hydrolase [Actinoplanes sp.]|jgi:pimeloyl-ACP methyl ester carboxylesterase
MSHAFRRKTTVLLAVAVLTTAGLTVAGSPANAATTPGIVQSSTAATLPPELAPLATGKRITYYTTSVSGSAITATGLVMTPKTGKVKKTVVWAHGTTGLADQCTPSTNQDVFWPEARAAVAALLRKGFTVTAPDYPGLGTSQSHPYLIGGSEGRAIIDSVKAARNLDSSLSTQYAIDGHSQGGQGALFAGELAPSYDGNLTLKGVSAIAPVSNADLFAPLIPGTPGQGYLVMALYGLQAVDTSFSATSPLADPAKLRTPVLTAGCLNEILSTYQSLTASQLLVGGALSGSLVDELVHFVNPAQQPSSAPILLIQGTEDEAVPYDITAEALLPELQQYSQPVQFVPVQGADHDGAVTATTSLVADWIAARFS